MSSACTCHIDMYSCEWCILKIRKKMLVKSLIENIMDDDLWNAENKLKELSKLNLEIGQVELEEKPTNF